MELDEYTLVLLLFVFAALFSAGTGNSYGSFVPVQAVAAVITIPLSIFAGLGGGLLGLIVAFGLLMWYGDLVGEGVVTLAFFAFTILLLGA